MANTDDTGAAMIDVREAVATAKSHMKEVFSGEGGDSPSLEEVWYDDDDEVWCVTFGIRHRRENKNTLSFETFRTADYKTVRISAKDGKLISVKLHETAA